MFLRGDRLLTHDSHGKNGHECLHSQRAAQHALDVAPTGQTVAWHNPDSGHHGTMTPVRTYQIDSGQYCREYQQTVVIGGQEERAFGTACRQPDGSWQIGP